MPEKFEFSLREANEAFEDKEIACKVVVEGDRRGVCLDFEGYGVSCCEPGYGGLVYVELYKGELRVLIWDDVNEEDATHIISLEGAKEENREEES